MRSPALAVPVCLLFALACSDSPTSSKSLLPGSSSLIIVPTGTLDENVIQILTLFPKGLETAATTRWGNVKSKYAVGLSDPAQMKVARQMAFELSDWVNKKAPEMDTPPNGETKVSASARAVSYMLMYIYNGPTTTVPPYSPAADAIVGLVTPGAPATVVTPSKHAGVSFQAGSVAENTVIVVSQNLTPFPENCSGPLRTLLCQYPMFYSFEAFPKVKLLKSGLFAICHVNKDGDPRHPLADHELLRLAHDKPANPADYTTGSTIRDQNGESIEILPKFAGTQTFVVCPPETIQSASAAGTNDGLFTRFARAVGKALTPKPAYAIDQGVGFLSDYFSNFNNVDPDGRPDRAVQSLTVTPVCGPTDCLAHPGSHLTVNFSVANIGTASTGDGVPGIIQLVEQVIEGEPNEFLVGSFGLAQVVPGASVAFTRDVVIPSSLPPGNYSLRVTVGIGFFPEIPPDLANNSSSVPVNITTADLNGLAIGAINDFQIAYRGNGVAAKTTEGQVNFSGLLSDEFSFTETSPTRLEIDRRSISADNASVRAAFRDLQRARATLGYAAAIFAVEAPYSSGHADLVSFNGFTELLLAENWCSGVPTSVLSPAGAIVYGPQQSTTDLLGDALARFDHAITIANSVEGGTIALNLARVGKARALLDLNNPAGAAAAAQEVPTDFAYSTGANDAQNNGVYEFQNVQRRWTVASGKGGNGLPYREDRRIAFEASGEGFDGSTPFHIQSKYPGLASPVPIALGLEARLIEAEAFLRAGDLASFTARINMVRVFYDLSAITAPVSAAAARETLFQERAYTLWLTSHRLGDMRRLVRQYGLSQSTVFPTGEHPKGGSYGSDVNFPIPVDATFNPTGLACSDRNP